MSDSLSKLPTIILLGILVAIFAALLKQNKTFRFRLWFVGWSLIFLRFVLQILWGPLGIPRSLYATLDLTSLQLAGIIFMVSVSALAETKWRNLYFVYFGGSIAVYAYWLTHDVEELWAYVCLLLAMSVIPTWALLRFSGVNRWNLGILAAAWIVIGWSIWKSLEGRPELGFYGFMSYIYGASGVLFCRKYRRLTPGIITTMAGFLGWAAISPLGVWFNYLPMSGTIQNDLWNLPKFVVAIGMIVTLLEDERISAEVARIREHTMSEQLRRFADLTSSLFRGGEEHAVFMQVAEAIVETANFRRVTIVLAEGPNRYAIVGHAGFDPAYLDKVKSCVAALTDETFMGLARAESRIGANSYRAHSDYDRMRIDPISASAAWADDDKVVIPLSAPGRGVVGAIGLDEPRVVEDITPENLVILEMLATDIAGAIENAKLQKHLFRSEKLAGMGQLVTGVAHELNNPLTAILGYSEILGDRASDSGMKRDLDVMRREALRMKRIIENLQRFSRQQRMEKKSVELRPILEDVLKLRAYDLHALNIRLSQDLHAKPMRVLADETLLHQVLMNILNNAMDAVEHQDDKRIGVELRMVGTQAQIRVFDNGPGFSDIARVFDPFYTTKGPGKGTGLGLSICYGIIREHGGDIVASNLQPQGASITIQLPLQAESRDRAPVATDTTA